LVLIIFKNYLLVQQGKQFCQRFLVPYKSILELGDGSEGLNIFLEKELDVSWGEFDGTKLPIIPPASAEPAMIPKPAGTNNGVAMIPADKAQPKIPIPANAPMPIPKPV
jgi:hypothetical protein